MASSLTCQPSCLAVVGLLCVLTRAFGYGVDSRIEWAGLALVRALFRHRIGVTTTPATWAAAGGLVADVTGLFHCHSEAHP